MRTRIDLDRPRFRGRNLRMTYGLQLPFSREKAWEWISDFNRFVGIDPYHQGVRPPLPELVPGAEFRLIHGVGAVRWERRGRILRVEPKLGYAFSDLSLRGPQAGFPHGFRVRLEKVPQEEDLCRLRIEVRGRWTADWVPSWGRRMWLWHTCFAHCVWLFAGAHWYSWNSSRGSRERRATES